MSVEIIARKAPINFLLLNKAINQAGPWKGQNLSVTPEWFLKEISAKINNTDWDAAKRDIKNFLRPRELPVLELWTKDFFLSRVDKLEGYME